LDINAALTKIYRTDGSIYLRYTLNVNDIICILMNRMNRILSRVPETEILCSRKRRKNHPNLMRTMDGIQIRDAYNII